MQVQKANMKLISLSYILSCRYYPIMKEVTKYLKVKDLANLYFASKDYRYCVLCRLQHYPVMRDISWCLTFKRFYSSLKLATIFFKTWRLYFSKLHWENNVQWQHISVHINLRVDFLHEFKGKLNWNFICYYQKLVKFW